MKVNVFSLNEAKARNIHFYKEEKKYYPNGICKYEFIEKSFNEEYLNDETLELYRGCNKTFLVPDDPNYKGPIVFSSNPNKATPIHEVDNPRKTYLAVFLHNDYDKLPNLCERFTKRTYFDKYYCNKSSTIMVYPAEMIYSRGKYWVVKAPEYFKVLKEETSEALLIDLEEE